MIFFNRKKILIIISIVMISIIVYNINIKIFSNQSNKDSIQTVALPVNNKTIIIDSGHRTEKMEGQ